MKKASFKIEGMTCASCAMTVEKTVANLAGVETVAVNIATEKMSLTYHEEHISWKDIATAIEKVGYHLLTDRKIETYLINDMTCASCAMAVEKALSNIEGIEEVVVNLATEKARVSYLGNLLTSQEICQSIEKAGYAASLVDKKSQQIEHREHDRQTVLLHRFTWSAIFTLVLLYIAMGPMVFGKGFPLPNWLHSPLPYTVSQLFLLLPVLYNGRSFFYKGFTNLLRRHPNMDSLIAVGTGAAVLQGMLVLSFLLLGRKVAMHGNHPELYFESAAVILTLITLGKYVENRSKGQTSEAIKHLMNLAPKTAQLIRENEEIEIPVEQLLVGDLLLVRPGQQVPVDGRVVKGESRIDESMLTGESISVKKEIGDKVYGGTLNQLGVFYMQAEQVGEDTTLAQIIRLVEEAQGSKAPIAKIADHVSSIFVPLVMALAVLSGLAWYLLGGESLTFSLSIAISVLVIACPCALGLATPTAIMVGTGRGAEMGLLFKSGQAIENLQGVDTIVFDKTGTITAGSPQLTDTYLFDSLSSQAVLQLAASAEQFSEHPLAQSLLEAARQENLELLPASDFHLYSGRGISVEIAEQTYFLGNRLLMEESQIECSHCLTVAADFAKEGKTPVFLGTDETVLAIFAISDPIKETSRQAIDYLLKRDLDVIMLTGDHQQTAQAIGKAVGIDKVISQVLPDHKAKQIKQLQSEGRRVAMVGDGINDAPALAQADLGLAIASGTDIAIESADVVLMHSDLLDVLRAIQLSQATLKTIKRNLFWAFTYNVVGIPIAMGLLYLFGGPLLNPMFAGAAMAFSSVSVVLNALGLKQKKLV